MTSQRTLSLEFRPFDPSHYDRFVEVRNANYPDQSVSVAEWRSWDEGLDKTKYLQKRFECIDQNDDEILGFGEVSHAIDMYHPRKFMVSILVDPPQQGKGIGRAIYDRIVEELAGLDAIVAWSLNKEDLPVRVEFFRRRGFYEKQRLWESHLNVTTANPSRFRQYLENASKQGITFTTLAEEQDKGPEALKKIHELVQLIMADMPREAPFTPFSYEQWEALALRNPRFLPEGFIIAKDGSRYVGLSNVHRNETQPQLLSQDDTGVIREYRGRGLAIALKLKITEYAQENHYTTIKTWNDSRNAPMLAVNTKLGFKRQVGWIMMEKTLQQEPSQN
jgi:GNAT superfamily N-acetyltransferase